MISVERLRIWLLVAAGLLTVVLLAFLGYAHLRARQFLTKLPGKLGVDLRQEANGFTWSQSLKGKTVFTIHATKAIQHLNGKVTLQDVRIIVYGQTQDRADRISGSEFEYDQAAGIVRAKGEVNLDLEAPAGAGTQAKPAEDRIIHAKTSGLVFLQKERVASTDNEVDFYFQGLTGHAKGANYSADAGSLALHEDVRMSGSEGGTPFTLTSSQASFDRPSAQISLRDARYTGGAASAQRKAKADRAVIFLRADGTAERVEAEGDVTLLDGSHSITGGRSRVSLADQNHLRLIEMWSGVRLADDTPGQRTDGRAEQGTARFDGTGRIQQISLNGKVDLHERQTPTDASAGSSDRTLSASTAELNFAAGTSSQPVLHAVSASGEVRVIILQSSGGSTPEIRSEMGGDRLHANLRSEGSRVGLSSIDGSGHTLLRRVDSKGSVETSTGETLQVDFASSKAQLPPLAHSRLEHAGSATSARSSGILQAVQRGGVTMTRLVAQPKGPPVSQQATAGQAVYDGPADRLTLTEGVHLFDKESDLLADSVRSSRGGDTTAEGAVRASYRRENEAEPVHVLGARAVMQNSAGIVTFYGADQKPARLWQQGSQVQAPVLTFNQKAGLLIASSGGDRSAGVRTVLAGRGTLPGDKAGSTETSVSRVQSSELRYSQADGTAKFLGGVRLDTGAAQLRGEEATVFLQESPERGKSSADNRQAPTPLQGSRDGFLGGALNHFVAKGQVVLDESGRRATGDQIVYTAADETFLLTGTAQTPPRITDESGTVVTGTSLRFRRGDNSVVVSGRNANGSETRRVHTETRIKQE